MNYFNFMENSVHGSPSLVMGQHWYKKSSQKSLLPTMLCRSMGSFGVTWMLWAGRTECTHMRVPYPALGELCPGNTCWWLRLCNQVPDSGLKTFLPRLAREWQHKKEGPTPPCGLWSRRKHVYCALTRFGPSSSLLWSLAGIIILSYLRKGNLAKLKEEMEKEIANLFKIFAKQLCMPVLAQLFQQLRDNKQNYQWNSFCCERP